MQARIDKADGPLRDVALRRDQPRTTLLHDEVPVQVGVVVQEELLYQLTLVAEAQDKVPMPEMGVVLHKVPQNGAAADVHEGLRNDVGMLPQPGAKAAAE